MSLPFIKGGQGRTDADVLREADAVTWWLRWFVTVVVVVTLAGVLRDLGVL